MGDPERPVDEVVTAAGRFWVIVRDGGDADGDSYHG
jgi:hypothetical protein